MLKGHIPLKHLDKYFWISCQFDSHFVLIFVSLIKESFESFFLEVIYLISALFSTGLSLINLQGHYTL